MGSSEVTRLLKLRPLTQRALLCTTGLSSEQRESHGWRPQRTTPWAAQVRMLPQLAIRSMTISCRRSAEKNSWWPVTWIESSWSSAGTLGHGSSQRSGPTVRLVRLPLASVPQKTEPSAPHALAYSTSRVSRATASRKPSTLVRPTLMERPEPGAA